MISETDAETSRSGNLPLPEEEVGTSARAERLRQAVDAAGGNASVARTIGMPLSTMGRYIAGRDMKASAMVALAQATGVRLEWLATGQGPRTDAEAGATTVSAPPPAPPSPLLSDRVDLDRLVQAYRAARQVTAEEEQLMQLTLRFHDVLAAQEAARAPAPAPAEGSRREPTTVKAP